MFSVRWKRSALNDLAELWTDADSEFRNALTKATNEIDTLLRNDPANQGESRPGGRRVMHNSPLGVLFKIDAQQSIVRVLQIWRY
jgi:hypothetical protein